MDEHTDSSISSSVPADPSPVLLTDLEARVLGCLMEKQMATPDYYPMTLSSLMAACNQKSNRDPVLALDESVIEQTLRDLRYEKKLVSLMRESGARVPKYQHEVMQHFEMSPLEKAIMAELMLRGPQTLGELRTRTPRMVPDAGGEQVERALESLGNIAGRCMVVKLPRAHGRRESRYAHQWCGEKLMEDDDSGSSVSRETCSPPAGSRMEALEKEVQALRIEIDELKEKFASFQKAFE